MAADIGLRGMVKGDNFELATNVTNAGNFDDIVYTTNGRRYYLQLNTTKILILRTCSPRTWWKFCINASNGITKWKKKIIRNS